MEMERKEGVCKWVKEGVGEGRAWAACQSNGVGGWVGEVYLDGRAPGVTSPSKQNGIVPT